MVWSEMGSGELEENHELITTLHHNFVEIEGTNQLLKHLRGD